MASMSGNHANEDGKVGQLVEEDPSEQTAGRYRARHPQGTAVRRGLTEALKIAFALPSSADVIDSTVPGEEEQERDRLRRIVEKHREYEERERARIRCIEEHETQSEGQRLWRQVILLVFLVIIAVVLFVTARNLG
jgi:hypothetical protein